MVESFRDDFLKPWIVTILTPELSRAYKRPKQPAPKFEARSPAGSIVRAQTIEGLIYAANLMGRNAR